MKVQIYQDKEEGVKIKESYTSDVSILDTRAVRHRKLVTYVSVFVQSARNLPEHRGRMCVPFRRRREQFTVISPYLYETKYL